MTNNGKYWRNNGKILDECWTNIEQILLNKSEMLGVGSLDITDDGCDRKRSGLMARDTEIHTVYHTGEKGGGARDTEIHRREQ